MKTDLHLEKVINPYFSTVRIFSVNELYTETDNNEHIYFIMKRTDDNAESATNFTPFEVLYIGQAGQSSSAMKRLTKGHSTLTKIMTEYNKELIYILVCNISADELAIPQDNSSLPQTMQDNHNFSQIINLTEAVLINYLRPKYNTYLTKNINNKNRKSYKDYFDLNYSSVVLSIEIDIYYNELTTETNNFNLEKATITYRLTDIDFRFMFS